MKKPATEPPAGPRVRVDSRERAIEACARLASARTYLLPLAHTRQSLVLYLLLCYFFLPSGTYLAYLLFYLAQRAIFLVFGAIEYFLENARDASLFSLADARLICSPF